MSQGATTFQEALARLQSAVERLEVSVSRRLESERQSADVERELARLSEDRSNLAQELDQSAARSSRLEDANREVSRRLVAAMESIRSVLDAHGG